MRSVLLLLGGLAVSAAGVLVVIGSEHDFAGILLIAAGAGVAILGQRAVSLGRPG